MTRRTIPTFTADGLHQRIADMERKIADLERRGDRPPPAIPRPSIMFHWPGLLSIHIDKRNGPGVLESPGLLHLVDYRLDIAPTSAVTVKWYVDNSGTATWTHTIPASATTHTEAVSLSYDGERLVGIVTAAGATVAGLTATLHLR